METATKSKPKTQNQNQNQGNQSGANKNVGDFFGKLYSFNVSLKLYHWHVTGKGSYAEHMALDQALETLADALDRIVETTYALLENIDITVPETPTPQNIVQHCSEFYDYIKEEREDLFTEDFSDSIIDDFQEAIQQLLYRLKKLQ
ncbi:MAG: DUF5856 family protein [Rikenellaceae bacterium]|nr:DUF5856 family protein [Rikenellaceae bacterium]